MKEGGGRRNNGTRCLGGESIKTRGVGGKQKKNEAAKKADHGTRNVAKQVEERGGMRLQAKVQEGMGGKRCAFAA